MVSAEVLDHLAAHDPRAQRSRRDLLRVHRAMGSQALVCSGWQAVLRSRHAGTALRVLELGAGDGRLLLGVARALAPAWPPVQLTLLDRQDIVSRATRAGFAELGWRVAVEVTDVLDWAAAPTSSTTPAAPAAPTTPAAPAPPTTQATATTPPAPPRWDLISTNLFLHHFQGAQLSAVLAAVAARSDRFFACEPRRGWPALIGSHLVGAIGANAVTREDAVLSVHAGFRADEISQLWPDTGSQWRRREHAGGLFSHCFSARRRGAD